MKDINFNFGEYRNYLLNNRLIEQYEIILQIFTCPSNFIDYSFDNWDKYERGKTLELIQILINLYDKNKNIYNSKIVLGQRIFWDEVFISYLRIVKNLEYIQNYKSMVMKSVDDYIEAVCYIKNVLQKYSDSRGEITRLEKVLGIDVNLDTLFNMDIKPLKGLINEQQAIIEKICCKIKKDFQCKWSTSNVYDVISHLLYKVNDDNPICYNLRANKTRVQLFIIDGFGYAQYLWNKNAVHTEKSYTYKENIFRWLSENSLSKELALGSSYITDTGAGLSQLFLGAKSIVTGVYSSKIFDRHNRQLFDIKKMDNANYSKYYNFSRNNIYDYLDTLGCKSKIYYCNKYSKSGFSNNIFGQNDIQSVVPSERVFNCLLDDLNSKDNLQTVYYTTMDNSGHTMGAYSRFEQYEHEKFDSLFKNYLITLARDRREIFDGKTSILITADHGMFDAGSEMIKRQDIKEVLDQADITECKIIENNRALFVYGWNSFDINKAKLILINYFLSINRQVDIITKNDVSFEDNIYKDGATACKELIVPDIIIRLIGEGLFYSNSTTNRNLFHFGGHGGASIDETLVPLISIDLTMKLYNQLVDKFIDIQ